MVALTKEGVGEVLTVTRRGRYRLLKEKFVEEDGQWKASKAKDSVYVSSHCNVG